MPYSGHNLRKALEKAQWAVDEATQRLNELQALQAKANAAVEDPDLVVCEPSYGLPSVARIKHLDAKWATDAA